MRISDWSSDVCSSDLFSVALLCAAATAAPVSAQTPTVITSLTDALRIGEDNAARLRAADAGLAGAGGALMQAGVRPNPELFVDAENFAGSKSYRSEEHTSELQSLMRISYAVFCLKKKTNTI